MPKLVDKVYSNGFSTYCGEEEILQTASLTEQSKITSMIELFLPSVNITDVKKVCNNFLTGMYILKKEEYLSRNSNAREHTMFHSTCASNVGSIIQNNLDWRRVSRSKFGTGVSFSSDADYANCHSNRSNGPRRAFIVAKVLVGKSWPGSRDLLIPPCPYDTTKDSNGKVVVKYNDNEFLPEYVAYYTCSNITSSKYYRRRGIHFSGWNPLLDML